MKALSVDVPVVRVQVPAKEAVALLDGRDEAVLIFLGGQLFDRGAIRVGHGSPLGDGGQGARELAAGVDGRLDQRQGMGHLRQRDLAERFQDDGVDLLPVAPDDAGTLDVAGAVVCVTRSDTSPQPNPDQWTSTSVS